MSAFASSLSEPSRLDDVLGKPLGRRDGLTAGHGSFLSTRIHYPECPVRYKIVRPSTWRLNGNAMSDYAVVNPATGETLATYPTITDDALEAAVAGANAAYRAWREVP